MPKTTSKRAKPSPAKKTYSEWLFEKSPPLILGPCKITEEEFLLQRKKVESPFYGLEDIQGLTAPTGLGSTYSIVKNGKTYRFGKAAPMGIFVNGSSPIELSLVSEDGRSTFEYHGCPRIRGQASMDRAIQWVERDWPIKQEEYRKRDIFKFFWGGCWCKAWDAFRR